MPIQADSSTLFPMENRFRADPQQLGNVTLKELENKSPRLHVFADRLWASGNPIELQVLERDADPWQEGNAALSRMTTRAIEISPQ